MSLWHSVEWERCCANSGTGLGDGQDMVVTKFVAGWPTSWCFIPSMFHFFLSAVEFEIFSLSRSHAECVPDSLYHCYSIISLGEKPACYCPLFLLFLVGISTTPQYYVKLLEIHQNRIVYRYCLVSVSSRSFLVSSPDFLWQPYGLELRWDNTAFQTTHISSSWTRLEFVTFLQHVYKTI